MNNIHGLKLWLNILRVVKTLQNRDEILAALRFAVKLNFTAGAAYFHTRLSTKFTPQKWALRWTRSLHIRFSLLIGQPKHFAAQKVLSFAPLLANNSFHHVEKWWGRNCPYFLFANAGGGWCFKECVKKLSNIKVVCVHGWIKQRGMS